MPRPLDTAATVRSVTDTVVKIEFGGSVVEVLKTDLLARMNGETDQTEVVLSNIAIALALAGVDIADDVAIKREVERRSFKMVR